MSGAVHAASRQRRSVPATLLICFVSSLPRPLNDPAISRECDRLADTAEFMGAGRNRQLSELISGSLVRV